MIPNPFLIIELKNIPLVQQRIQDAPLYAIQDENSSKIFLTSTAPGVHIREQQYDYLSSVFFQYLCVEIGSNTKNLYPMYDCMCSGFDFGGMPQVEFIVNDNKDGADSVQRFLFEPDDYMLFPKMNTELRRAYC